MQMQVVILGTGAVGKSAITINFVKKFFCDEYDPTIEDSYSKQVVVDGKSVVLDILDTAGQDEYSAMRETYMRGGEGFILVYSLNSRDSFDEVLEFAGLISRVKDVDIRKVPLLLLGNKCDLPEEEWEVSEQEGKELAKNLGAKFFLTSAYLTINIQESFEQMVRQVRSHKEREDAEATKKGKKSKLSVKQACKML